MTSPCQDCPHRKLYCHDRCDEYLEWHDTILAAKKALKVADKAVSLLAEGYAKRSKRWTKGGKIKR